MYLQKAADRIGPVPILTPCIACVTAALAWLASRSLDLPQTLTNWRPPPAGLILPRRRAMSSCHEGLFPIMNNYPHV
jgi:hypothetical protein